MAELRRVKIPLRWAETEMSEAEKRMKELPWKKRGHMVPWPRNDSQVTAEF